MSIFAVLSKNENPILEQRIEAEFPDNYYKFSSSQWFVSFDGTSKDVSDKLGVTSKEDPISAVIVDIASYWGRSSLDLWDWLKQKWEKSDG